VTDLCPCCAEKDAEIERLNLVLEASQGALGEVMSEARVKIEALTADRDRLRRAVAAETERCARIAEKEGEKCRADTPSLFTSQTIAAAIRGEKE
jgi:hypothetical protein